MSEECCDICGNIGVADALITCSICKRNTEHMYCMKFFLEEHVNDWRCEECMSGVHNSSVVHRSGELPAESRKLPNESRVGVGDWEKIVATGKTKYLTVEEAIKLPLGQKLPYNAFHKRTPRRNSVKYKFDSTIKPRFIDFSSLQNITPGPFRSLKPRRPANVDIHRKPNLTGFRSPSSLPPSEALKDTNLVKEQPSNPVTTRAVKQSSLPSENTSPGAISGGDGHDNAIDRSTSGAENTSEIYLLDSEKDSRVPALEASWKGSFRILDDNAQKEINHLVRAYPPFQVYKKIFDISKKMPQVLHFELVPSKPILNNLFNDYIPDRNDIGLYFFPGAGESSEEGNIFLADQIISTNYALRKQIADVELLVFSSKLLHANCQSWQGKHFLWGVFRHLKLNATTCSEDRVLEPTVQPSDGVNHDQGQVHGSGEVDIEIDMTDGVNHDQGQVHDGGEVDMEIDMIGGINLGKIDVPVNKKPTASLAWPESVVPCQTVAPVAKIPSPIVKVESHDLIPPGFEEVYRMRVQSSSPPVAGIWNQDINKG
ncbi:uncharacterized protein LOC125215817 isoform X2 [Salvia hispanica]|uniref:uncharacterized protein LOC125215817 isoform X2 n=1 Tax=Salvia hispanica TaxID=49212 RepID=UPI0020097F02|nr:uncharacterized protein LOC125215817 isoform X2 [Salvia hispanica]